METYVNLTDIEDFAVANEALFKILFHGSPQYIICLMKSDQFDVSNLDVYDQHTASPHHSLNASRSALK